MIPQHRYVMQYAAEIEAAIADEYPAAHVYVGTRRIAHRIFENPHKYPLMASRPIKAVKGIIGLYLSQVKRYKQYSCQKNAHCGTVYVVNSCPVN